MANKKSKRRTGCPDHLQGVNGRNEREASSRPFGYGEEPVQTDWLDALDGLDLETGDVPGEQCSPGSSPTSSQSLGVSERTTTELSQDTQPPRGNTGVSDTAYLWLEQYVSGAR